MVFLFLGLDLLASVIRILFWGIAISVQVDDELHVLVVAVALFSGLRGDAGSFAVSNVSCGCKGVIC